MCFESSDDAAHSSGHKMFVASEDRVKGNSPKIAIHNILSADLKMEMEDNKTSSSDSPNADKRSVRTYPSIGELNLTFSSLTAQRLLCGASVNSLDTLVEVNLRAETAHAPNDAVSPVKKKDLGFV